MLVLFVFVHVCNNVSIVLSSLHIYLRHIKLFMFTFIFMSLDETLIFVPLNKSYSLLPLPNLTGILISSKIWMTPPLILIFTNLFFN